LGDGYRGAGYLLRVFCIAAAGRSSANERSSSLPWWDSSRVSDRV